MARFNYDIRRRKLGRWVATVEQLRIELARAKYQHDICQQQLMDAQRGIAIYNQWRKQTGPWRG